MRIMPFQMMFIIMCSSSCCTTFLMCVLLIILQLQLQPSEGKTQNFSVSFDSLLPPENLTIEGYGEVGVYGVYESDSTDFQTSVRLLFLPASSNASSSNSYILSILAYAQFGDAASLVFTATAAILWMANRDNPVSGNFSLSLNQSSGNLVLLDGNGSLAWSSNSAVTPQGAVFMDLIFDINSNNDPVGTLLLSDAKNRTLWRSSDHPTHTLMSQQLFEPSMRLISWAAAADPSEGLYSLVMEAGGLALYYNAFSYSRQLPYWIWGIYGRNDSFGVTHTCSNLTHAFVDGVAGLVLEQDNEIAALDVKSPDLCSAHNDNDSGIHQLIFGGSDAVQFLWLNFDGNLYGYGLGSALDQELDLFKDNRCLLPNFCGPYGVCKAPDSCGCPGDASFPSTFPFDRSQGCPPSVTHFTCHNQTLSINAVNSSDDQTSPQLQLVELTGVDYFTNKYSSPLNFSTQDACKEVCLQNCSCLAAFWHVHSSSCFHVDHMSSLQGSLNNSYLAFLKVAASPQPKSGSSALRLVLAGAVVGLVLIISCVLMAAFICTKRLRADVESDDEEPFWNSVPGLAPNRYSYQDLDSITNGFSEQMGKGGFGAVYAGVLKDGTTRVAVKRLESLRQGRKEFKAEVVILGGIHHYNLVGLLGFCAEGSHRLLVYEYMPKGSLDQWLFTTTTETPPLHWKYRFNIALGAARGLAYLHGECQSTIIHLDIKPQNILLDEGFVAKISDFGLSTLMSRDQTHVVTTMRGTPGYLAPEWLNESSALSEKCDVFSFGKLLMEILGGRRNLDLSLEGTEKLYFPSWLYQQVAQQGREADLTHIARVETPEETRQARLMMNTAFLCVLENPDLRPSMERVVHMLEGHAPELEHLQLSDLSQDLHFALRMQSDPNLAQARIERTLAPIYQSSNSLKPGTSQGGVMSLHISAR